MFPNPQDALPLPKRPSLDEYKKLAKDLLRAAQSKSHDALRSWSETWVNRLVKRSGIEVPPRLPVRTDRWIEDVATFAQARLTGGKLSDAQFVIARSHGFPSWSTFLRHIRNMAGKNSPEAQFEAAADAIITGKIATLRRLLRAHPRLVHRCSSREHRATLLHYVSANGVEGYRQKTPKNIVEITRLLLRAGSDVNAGADVYGGNCTALGLVATSVHPQEAGVQQPLMQLLLDHGAVMDMPGLAGHNQLLVLACLANGQPEAARFLAERGAALDLETAAGAGKLELVKDAFDADGKLKPPTTHRQLQNGFLWACMCGHKDVVVFLLDHGAHLHDPADSGATALHWAAGAANVELVKLLIQRVVGQFHEADPVPVSASSDSLADRGPLGRRSSPLEVINRWGGTVLEHAGYGFEHDRGSADFAPTFETLLAAGAKIRGAWLKWIKTVKSRSLKERKLVAQVFRRHGATE